MAVSSTSFSSEYQPLNRNKRGKSKLKFITEFINDVLGDSYSPMTTSDIKQLYLAILSLSIKDLDKLILEKDGFMNNLPFIMGLSFEMLRAEKRKIEHRPDGTVVEHIEPDYRTRLDRLKQMEKVLGLEEKVLVLDTNRIQLDLVSDFVSDIGSASLSGAELSDRLEILEGIDGCSSDS